LTDKGRVCNSESPSSTSIPLKGSLGGSGSGSGSGSGAGSGAGAITTGSGVGSSGSGEHPPNSNAPSAHENISANTILNTFFILFFTPIGQ